MSPTVERRAGTRQLGKEEAPDPGNAAADGEVVLHMLANVQQVTSGPLIRRAIAAGTVVDTDEYDVYHRLPEWGDEHHSVGHSPGEYARDGFHAVHVNTIEGFWMLLRSWLRPHRGISQENLPLSLGFFEFVHNLRRRATALLRTLVELWVK